MPKPQKFTEPELSTLREGLRQDGLDSFQAGALLTGFLAAHGYGSSSDEARQAASRLEAAGCPLPQIQRELEGLGSMA